MALWLTRSVTLTEKINLPELPAWRSEEKRTLIIFSLTAFAWITRGAPLGGWSTWFDVSIAGDSTVALAAVIIMFMTPNGKGGRILDWDTAKEIPWGMLLLFAGGIALAKGFAASGLSAMLGDWLSSLANLPMLAMVLTICLVVTYVTEITSNTATATLLMPILAVVGISVGVDPAVFMVPAAMAASCAFMLPVATAPNAIVYGAGEIEIKEMVLEGALLSLIVSCIIAVITYAMLH
jgi:sodium-dependent dicarboxylate transporter 2/3/5